ncbi:hypothetical protein SACS_0432 [Parasaccharibacter apium]|uniref:Uncharacterized protein n=1 Tax=Parasaccharibacter apium TaxID=1510841 RepID=A0A7U7J052_9PROT|nr:hypothetical protein SACS_0432 [Parasaccharibacter apium]
MPAWLPDGSRESLPFQKDGTRAYKGGFVHIMTCNVKACHVL